MCRAHFRCGRDLLPALDGLSTKLEVVRPHQIQHGKPLVRWILVVFSLGKSPLIAEGSLQLEFPISSLFLRKTIRWPPFLVNLESLWPRLRDKRGSFRGSADRSGLFPGSTLALLPTTCRSRTTTSSPQFRRDDGRFSGRNRARLCVFRGSAAADSLRHHDSSCGEDSGGGQWKKTRAFLARILGRRPRQCPKTRAPVRPFCPILLCF